MVSEDSIFPVPTIRGRTGGAIGRAWWLPLVILLTAGCGSEGRSSLSGDWTMAIERDLLAGVVDSTGTDGDPEDAAADPLPPRMQLRFFWSGQLETRTRMGSVESTKQGQWEVVDYDDQGRVKTIECDLTGQTTQHKIRWIDADTISLVPPNLAGLKRPIQFARD